MLPILLIAASWILKTYNLLPEPIPFDLDNAPPVPLQLLLKSQEGTNTLLWGDKSCVLVLFSIMYKIHGDR